MLGKPTGDFGLSEVASRCHVSIINDILPGKVGFEKPVVKVKQTDEEIVIPVHRTINTESKIK